MFTAGLWYSLDIESKAVKESSMVANTSVCILSLYEFMKPVRPCEKIRTQDDSRPNPLAYQCESNDIEIK